MVILSDNGAIFMSVANVFLAKGSLEDSNRDAMSSTLEAEKQWSMRAK